MWPGRIGQRIAASAGAGDRDPVTQQRKGHLGERGDYTTIPSIQEILVIDLVEIEAHVLRWPAEGAWPQQTLSRRDDTVTLESIGFTALLAAFYRTMA